MQRISPISSDLWSLGCVLYQFVAGCSPFRGDNDYKTFRNIKKTRLKFPKGNNEVSLSFPFCLHSAHQARFSSLFLLSGFPEVAKDLVLKLLVPDWTQRLGMSP